MECKGIFIMEVNEAISIQRHFESLEDPRILLKSSHKLIDVIILAICAVIAGADKWTQIEEFAKSNEEWFKQFLELRNGIPSHDTFGRIFSILSPKKFLICFQSWIKSVFQAENSKIIAIDGKSLRRSHDKRRNKSILHMLHAWSCDSGLLLGQLKTKEKSNEITVIPELLKMLHIKGCIVTMDAMGCQKKIAEQIHSQKGDYILAVKDNQKELKCALKKTFDEAQKNDFRAMKYSKHESVEKEHGRVEIRKCYVLPLMYLYEFKLKWKGLNSLILVESERFYQGETVTQQRFYISSLKADAEKISSCVRQHWLVENKLHWSLDVAFREDECRVRIGNAAENFSLLRKIALTCLKKDTACKGGIQTKRLKCGWDKNYFLNVLRLC